MTISLIRSASLHQARRQGEAESDRQRQQDRLNKPHQSFTYALVSASFSLFFGGSWLDAAASGVIGVALKCLDRMIRKTEANAFLSALLCSCLGGLLAGCPPPG